MPENLATVVAPDQVSSGSQSSLTLVIIATALLILGVAILVPRLYRAYRTGILLDMADLIDRRDRPVRFWYRVTYWSYAMLMLTFFFLFNLYRYY